MMNLIFSWRGLKPAIRLYARLNLDSHAKFKRRLSSKDLSLAEFIFLVYDSMTLRNIPFESNMPRPLEVRMEWISADGYPNQKEKNRISCISQSESESTRLQLVS